MATLYLNGTQNGLSPGILTSMGGNYVATVSGNFDGASVKLLVKSPADPNNEWVSQKTYTSSENDSVIFLPLKYQARAEIINAGPLTDIFMEVRL